MSRSRRHEVGDGHKEHAMAPEKRKKLRAELLFLVVSSFYEMHSIIIKSNLLFDEWEDAPRSRAFNAVLWRVIQARWRGYRPTADTPRVWLFIILVEFIFVIVFQWHKPVASFDKLDKCL